MPRSRLHRIVVGCLLGAFGANLPIVALAASSAVQGQVPPWSYLIAAAVGVVLFLFGHLAVSEEEKPRESPASEPDRHLLFTAHGSALAIDIVDRPRPPLVLSPDTEITIIFPLGSKTRNIADFLCSLPKDSRVSLIFTGFWLEYISGTWKDPLVLLESMIHDRYNAEIKATVWPSAFLTIDWGREVSFFIPLDPNGEQWIQVDAGAGGNLVNHLRKMRSVVLDRVFDITISELPFSDEPPVNPYVSSDNREGES